MHVGKGENSEEIEKALWNLKEILPFDPLMITVDFAQAWFEPIKKVFPNSAIQIDLFHVMQDLIKALSKDLIRYKNEMYDNYINNAKKLANNTLKCQKEGIFSNIKLENLTIEKIQDGFLKLNNFFKETDPSIFKSKIMSYIENIYNLSTPWGNFLGDELIKRLPTNDLTQKNLKYYKANIFKAFRNMLRYIRKEKEADKKKFSQIKSLIVTSPEKLTESNEKILNTYLSLGQMEDEIKAYVLREEVSRSNIRRLSALTSDDRLAVLSLISSLKLGENRLREVLTLLEEISRRNQCTTGEIVRRSEIQTLLSHKELTPSQKTDHVKKALMILRYPKMHQLEAAFEKKKKNLNLPSNLSLHHPPFFEGKGLRAEFQFETIEEYRSMLSHLYDLADKEEFQEILRST